MLKQNKALSYYLYSLSNLIAAFGGGLILGKGIGIISHPFLKGSSLLALFIGIVFGLSFLRLISKKYSEVFHGWFSIFGGISSLFLILIYTQFAIPLLSGYAAFLFFIILSIRFGFWFFFKSVTGLYCGQRRKSNCMD